MKTLAYGICRTGGRTGEEKREEITPKHSKYMYMYM